MLFLFVYLIITFSRSLRTARMWPSLKFPCSQAVSNQCPLLPSGYVFIHFLIKVFVNNDSIQDGVVGTGSLKQSTTHTPFLLEWAGQWGKAEDKHSACPQGWRAAEVTQGGKGTHWRDITWAGGWAARGKGLKEGRKGFCSQPSCPLEGHCPAAESLPPPPFHFSSVDHLYHKARICVRSQCAFHTADPSLGSPSGLHSF